MSLYKDWQTLYESQSTNEQQRVAFWQAYFDEEKKAYQKVLAKYPEVYSGTVKELAETFAMEPAVFAGFLDGANHSFVSGEKDVENVEEDTQVILDFDWEKLYYNMHDAKADWLFNLHEWEQVLNAEKRHEITKAYRASKIFVNTVKIGRNDPCPCGSGKKYKNCCGRNA